MDWPKEEIPEEDLLYMRIPQALINAHGEPEPGAFINHPKDGGMSTNWSKYSTPSQTLSGARKPGAKVTQMLVGEVIGLPGQRVEHTPDCQSMNRAHTDVFGDKTPEVRMKFTRICKWADTSQA